jgi:archaellum component FlaC
MDDLLWESRILEQRAQERVEWQMMTKRQLDSQIDRVKATLERQKRANSELRFHIQRLELEIEELGSITDPEPQD